MNSKTFLFNLIGIFLVTAFLSACNQISTQSAASSKNTLSVTKISTSPTTESNQELKGQDVSDITKLVTPDELVYLHNDSETVYTSSNPKFQTIIQLNSKRQTQKLAVLKLLINNDVVSHGDFLIYKYTNTNYASIYFKLAQSPDQNLDNWVVNYYGSNFLPAYTKKYGPSKTEAYGHLAPADELLTYLKS